MFKSTVDNSKASLPVWQQHSKANAHCLCLCTVPLWPWQHIDHNPLVLYYWKSGILAITVDNILNSKILWFSMFTINIIWIFIGEDVILNCWNIKKKNNGINMANVGFVVGTLLDMMLKHILVAWGPIWRIHNHSLNFSCIYFKRTPLFGGL